MGYQGADVCRGGAAAGGEQATSEPAAPVSGAKLILLVAVLLTAQTLDGMDMNALAFVGAAVRQDLGLTRTAFGACVGAAFLGTAIGAAMFGAVADRIGRRKALLAVVCLFGVASLVTSRAENAVELVVIRGLTGLALGGLLPISTALLIANSAKAARTTAVTVVTAGSAGGAVLAGLVSSLVVPDFGWRSVFVIGGFAPLVVMPLLWIVVPRDRPQPAAVARSGDEKRAGGLALFRDGAWRLTVRLWIGMFFGALPVFVTVGWLPSLIEAKTASLAHAAVAASFFSIGGALGGIAAGALTDRFGMKVILPWALAGTAATALLGFAIGTPAVAFVAGGAGFFTVALLTLMGAVAGQIYPDAIRALGVGASLAVMRIGAAVAPWGAGKLLDLGTATGLLFLLCAGAAALSGIAFRAAARLQDG